MNKEWLSYPRTVVLLLGLGLAGVLAWILFHGGQKEQNPWWEGALLLLLAVWAIILLFVGLFGSNRIVEKWGDWSTTHEASIIVMIVAAPIYWLLKAVTHKR